MALTPFLTWRSAHKVASPYLLPQGQTDKPLDASKWSRQFQKKGCLRTGSRLYSCRQAHYAIQPEEICRCRHGSCECICIKGNHRACWSVKRCSHSLHSGSGYDDVERHGPHTARDICSNDAREGWDRQRFEVHPGLNVRSHINCKWVWRGEWRAEQHCPSALLAPLKTYPTPFS